MKKRKARRPRRPRKLVGSLATCVFCEQETGGMFVLGGGRKVLTWRLAIPDESAMAKDFREREIRVCRTHFVLTCDEDDIIRNKWGDIPLVEPPWWAQASSDEQLSYLNHLLAVVQEVPKGLLAKVEKAFRGEPTKGLVGSWIQDLQRLPKKPDAGNTVTEEMMYPGQEPRPGPWKQ